MGSIGGDLESRLSAHGMAHDTEPLPAEPIRHGDRVRRDRRYVVRSRFASSIAVTAEFDASEAEGIRIDGDEHRVEIMCVAEPAVNEDHTDGTAAVSIRFHNVGPSLVRASRRKG